MNPSNSPLHQALMSRTAGPGQGPGQGPGMGQPVGPPLPPSPPLAPNPHIQDLMSQMKGPSNPIASMLGAGDEHKVKLSDPSGASQEVTTTPKGIQEGSQAAPNELPTVPSWVQSMLGNSQPETSPIQDMLGPGPSQGMPGMAAPPGQPPLGM